MDSNQIGGILRALLPVLTVLVAAWGIDSATWTVISGALVTIVMALWSWYTNSPVAIIKQADRIPEVKRIEVEPALGYVAGTEKVVLT